MQQRRLGLADVGGQVLEARGLAGLTLQVLDLAFEFADHVVETFEVLLGGAQPELGFVPPRVQARNAGRLFEQRAAGLRLRLDQFADAPLPHHGGRAGAGRLVGEQKLHVLGARFLAVDAIDRAGLALDAARHLQFVGIVEGGGRGAVDIVEEKRDFGGVSAGLVPEPEKMTSSMPDARMFLYELSPITQRSASTRFDLPQPFGPTMPVSPRSMTNSPGSTKDLNPRRRRRENFMRAYPRASGNPLALCVCKRQSMPSMIADISAIVRAPL